MIRSLTLIGLLAALVACRPGTREAEEVRPLFVERAVELGVDFEHETGASGRLFMPETTGGGVALFDYDRDGDIDIYLVQGGRLEQPSTLADRLYRNDLSTDIEWRFSDVTAAAGLTATRYGQGVAIGDADNDGWLDIFLANLGPDELWLNNGDGSFRNGTQDSGLGDDGWATSAVFLDFNGDGWQDLFVTRYLVWSIASHKDCRFQTGMLDYCKPASYSPTFDRLYRNLGGGRFELFDSPELGALRTNGLGVIAADLNGDGWLDLYVANDQLPNALWVNENGTGMREEALLAGVAVNREGMAEASMGLVADDLDNDGRLDLFMTHLDGETNTFYRNRGDGLFDDQTQSVGLASPSLARTAFGVGAVDYDHDSWLDLVLTTGAVHVDVEQQKQGLPLPLQQTDQMFRNHRGQFSEISELAGVEFSIPSVGRGLAVGDLDHDGHADLVINNAQARPRILINLADEDRDWMGFRLGPSSGRVAEEGTPVRLVVDRGTARIRWVRRGASFLSAHDERVLFGLEPGVEVGTIEVEWNPGMSQRWSDLPTGSYIDLFSRMGAGR